MANVGVSHIQDKNGVDTYDIEAVKFDGSRTITLTGSVTGSQSWDGASGLSISNTLIDGAVTTSKLGTGAVTGDKILDGTITHAKLNAEVYQGAVADNDSKLSTHAAVKTYVDAAITGQGTYRGKQTCATINTWTSANLNNGDRVICADAGTITLGSLTVREGEDLIFYKPQSGTALWQSMDGDFKLRQTAVTGTGSTTKTITQIVQNENGDITTTFSDIATASNTAAGLTKVYTASGTSTDGTMTQKAITENVSAKLATSTFNTWSGAAASTFSGTAAKAVSSTKAYQDSYGTVINASSYLTAHLGANAPITISNNKIGNNSSGVSVTGTNAWAEGKNTSAHGEASHAEGNATLVNGRFAHVEGNGAKATGNASHAEGFGSSAQGFASHAAGILTNIIDQGGTSIGISNATVSGVAFVIGNGVYDATQYSATKSDAFKVDWSGNVSAAGAISAAGKVYSQGKEVLTAHQSLAGYVPTGRTVNGKSLSANVTIGIGDISNLGTYTGYANDYNTNKSKFVQTGTSVTLTASYATNAGSATKAYKDSYGTVINASSYLTNASISGKLDTTAFTAWSGTRFNGTSANTAINAGSATKALQDGSGNVITATYVTTATFGNLSATYTSTTKTLKFNNITFV